MTYLEAVNRYLDMVRESRLSTVSGATGYGAIAKWLVNEAMRDVFFIHDWPWRRRQDVLQTVAPHTTGTVTVTNGSTTVTGSGTSFTSSMVGRKFRKDGDLDFYEIASFTSSTEIKLADAYVNATAAGADYSIFQDVYTLNTNVDRVIDVMLQDPDMKLVWASPQEFWGFFPNPETQSHPDTVFIYETDSSGDWTVQFYPIPDDVYQLFYIYYFTPTELSSDSDDFKAVNRIPDKLHQLIVDRAYIRGLATGLEDDLNMSRTVEDRWNTLISEMIRKSQPDKGRVRRLRHAELTRDRQFIRLPPDFQELP